MAAGERWTRDQLLVALNIYEKLPFGQFDERNPVVQDVAKRLKRTAGSLAMKLCNLASLDPAVKARGRTGLPGASELDRQVWSEFRAAREVMGPVTEAAFRLLFSGSDDDDVEVVKGVGVRVTPRAPAQPPVGETEVPATVTVRRGQQFFRQMVLNAFDGRCCVTGIDLRELLVASHIKPWGAFPETRLDLRNGLCLSRLHDAAFDRGLIAFDDDCRLLLSRELRGHLPQTSLDHNFRSFEGRRITIPEASLGPSPEFLQHHRETVFLG